MSKAVDEFINEQKRRGMWFEAPQWAVQMKIMADNYHTISVIQYAEHQAKTTKRITQCTQ